VDEVDQHARARGHGGGEATQVGGAARATGSSGNRLRSKA
jgi:hypothetical protein